MPTSSMKSVKHKSMAGRGSLLFPLLGMALPRLPGSNNGIEKCDDRLRRRLAEFKKEREANAGSD